MNHDRFIELLNLYLDGEISREDSVELERQILTNPERRKIYRQYCQMQRACGMLAEKFRDEAEVPEIEGDGNVVQFPGRRPAVSWARGLTLVAGGAAAAAALFVTVQSNFTTPAADTTPTVAAASANPASSSAAARELAIPVGALVASGDAQLRSVGTMPNLMTAFGVRKSPEGVRVGERGSLFSAIPPLPESQRANSIRIDYRADLPSPMVLEPLRLPTEQEINAMQFPR